VPARQWLRLDRVQNTRFEDNQSFIGKEHQVVFILCQAEVDSGIDQKGIFLKEPCGCAAVLAHSLLCLSSGRHSWISH
jgi:hypothetical protein